MNRKIFFFLLVPVVLIGCKGDPFDQEERARVEGALETALSAWKGGTAAKKWNGKTNPILFDDYEWKKGFRLVDYRIEELRKNSSGSPEALVQLSLQPPRGEKIERQALYGIVFKDATRIAIGRDPMY